MEKDGIYEKKVICPICNKEIAVSVVKTSSIRILSKDSDFMIRYGDINPMFYDIWVCKFCGYAASSNKFSAISDKQIKLIKENISSKWVTKEYPSIHDQNLAVELYQLALLNCMVKCGKESEKGYLCLRIAWMYRLLEDEKNEKRFIENALGMFLIAFEKENFPIIGLNEAYFEYLIGEFYRRLGKKSESLLWFSKVLSSRSADSKIKEKTRDQKDLLD